MSESSSDLEPSPHAAHLPDRALSPMTVSLDGLLSAMARSVPTMALPIPLLPLHTTSPSPPTDMNDPFYSQHYCDNGGLLWDAGASKALQVRTDADTLVSDDMSLRSALCCMTACTGRDRTSQRVAVPTRYGLAGAHDGCDDIWRS